MWSIYMLIVGGAVFTDLASNTGRAAPPSSGMPASEALRFFAATAILVEFEAGPWRRWKLKEAQLHIMR